MSKVSEVSEEESTRTIPSYLIEQFEYDIQVIEYDDGISQIHQAKKAIINIQDDESTLEFKKKKNSDPLLIIPLKDIEIVTATAAQTKHMMVKRNNLMIEIAFTNSQGNRIPIQNKRTIKFDVDDKYVPIIQKQIDLLNHIKNNNLVRKAIAVLKNPKLCNICARNEYSYVFSSVDLCLNCFQRRYGKILLSDPAEYYGGHKAHLAGGVFNKFESGEMHLTENYLIYLPDKDESWEIIIPLNSVIVENWQIEEVGRRQQISGLGSSTANFGYGSGMIHDSGKAHHLVVPYKDENEIPQAPRFGVSSFRGKAIREWALKLYEQVVKVRNENARLNAEARLTTINEGKNTQTGDDDPVKVLKIRFAKGEISKEEYEEMRKMIES